MTMQRIIGRLSGSRYIAKGIRSANYMKLWYLKFRSTPSLLRGLVQRDTKARGNLNLRFCLNTPTSLVNDSEKMRTTKSG